MFKGNLDKPVKKDTMIADEATNKLFDAAQSGNVCKRREQPSKQELMSTPSAMASGRHSIGLSGWGTPMLPAC